MRVTGGQLAGRMLHLPKGPRIRSTQDQVRQALFNILGERVKGARVLDLFAGSGGLGIEAISRGAKHATLIDRSGFCVRAIELNLKELLGAAAWEFSVFSKSDALSAIPRLAEKGKPFDLVLLDPPYEGDLARKTLSALCRYAIVSRSGWVVVEHGKRDPPPPAVDGPAGRLVSQRVETYGDTALTFYTFE